VGQEQLRAVGVRIVHAADESDHLRRGSGAGRGATMEIHADIQASPRKDDPVDVSDAHTSDGLFINNFNDYDSRRKYIFDDF
jgi:hypothetical protein